MIALFAYTVCVALTTMVLVHTTSRVIAPVSGAPLVEGDGDPGGTTVEAEAPVVHLPFGAQNMPVDSLTIAAGATGTLLHFDVLIQPAAAPTPRAALISFRVECGKKGQRVNMQADGKVSTNIFLARGGQVGSQALTPGGRDDLVCTLLASAPFIAPAEDGVVALALQTDLTQSAGGNHLLALHRLDDAMLLLPGTAQVVLSRRVEDPSSLDRIGSTVRLTSCTVVGGSRDSGENKCLPSMTGRESATVRVRVVARWLGADGVITGTTTYWDETLAVDYNTHHVPWTLRQENLGKRVPPHARAAVVVVVVESIGGTPVVVHADGTDAVITTHVCDDEDSDIHL